MDIAEKGARFRALHEARDTFVIPNPWDVGSARVLAGMGFQALATTSSGLAYTRGLTDGQVTRATHLAHVRDVAEATPLPVSADLENCYADDPTEAAETIPLAAEAGAAGCSIEDYSGHPDGRIYDFDHAVERVAAAVEAARRLPAPFTLTARAENLVRGRQDLDDTVRRLQAYAAAGADVVYAPGLKTVDEVQLVCEATPKPVNVLATPTLSMAEIAEAGARRISLGGALCRAAIGGYLEVVRNIREKGDFSGLGSAPGFPEINAIVRGSSQ